MAFPLAVRIDVIHKGFVLTLVIGFDGAAVEDNDAGTDTYRCSLGQLADVLPGCKHPGKPNHSLLEIFRHTDYVL